jgi:hypothetical protein
MSPEDIAVLVATGAPDHAAHSQEQAAGPPGYIHLHCSCGVGLSFGAAPPIPLATLAAARVQDDEEDGA